MSGFLFIYFSQQTKKLKPELILSSKSFGMTYEEWFETALRESEFDVLVRFLGNPEEATAWKYDENLCQFVRRSDAE